MTFNIGFWTDVESTDVDNIIVNIGFLKTDVANMNYTHKMYINVES